MFTMGTPLRGNPPGTTWNPADKGASVVLSNANRDATGGISVRAIASASSGKKYFEILVVSTAGPNIPRIGIANTDLTTGDRIGDVSYSAAYTHNTGTGLIYTNGSFLFGGSVPTFTAGDVIGIAVDIDAGKLWFAKNNTWVNDQGGAIGNPGAGANQRATITTGKTYFPAISAEAWLLRANFAASDFAYPAPSGFVAW